MTWYYDLSPFSLACSCIVESSLGLMCRNGISRSHPSPPHPDPQQGARGRPGWAGPGPRAGLQRRTPPPPRRSGPFPSPSLPTHPPVLSPPIPSPPRGCRGAGPAAGAGCVGMASRRCGAEAARGCRHAARALHARAGAGAQGVGWRQQPCHPLRTVTINIASTC